MSLPAIALRARAEIFRSLHRGAGPLALANAWDAASAAVIEAAGASAIATSSAGVAWSLGRADGDILRLTELIPAVERIVRVVAVPVSVDIESGFADHDAREIETTLNELLRVGAVGINIEDGAVDPEEGLLPRLSFARSAAERAGVPIFINARTDVFLRGIGAPETRMNETIARAARYLEAGADGIFVPGVADPEVIAALVAGIPAPVNVMVGPGSPSVAELGRLGVARASLGSDLAQAAYGLARRAATEMLASGTYGAVSGGVDYGDLNALMARSGRADSLGR